MLPHPKLLRIWANFCEIFISQWWHNSWGGSPAPRSITCLPLLTAEALASSAALPTLLQTTHSGSVAFLPRFLLMANFLLDFAGAIVFNVDPCTMNVTITWVAVRTDKALGMGSAGGRVSGVMPQIEYDPPGPGWHRSPLPIWVNGPWPRSWWTFFDSEGCTVRYLTHTQLCWTPGVRPASPASISQSVALTLVMWEGGGVAVTEVSILN